ncbi:MAG: UDP-glucose/GDP-mannose dehydrogenase family protein, partial [Candidatus Pacebacteria bacterium CG_4_10_14_0_8_um_filter_43_12]
EAIFMCLPTPEKLNSEEESDLTYYYAATEKIAASMVSRCKNSQENYIVIINKSTVSIALINETEEILKKKGVKNFGVVSNPEFLVEGKAIEGTVRPDRVVVGAWKENDFKIVRKIYQRFYSAPNVEYIEINPLEAAAGKLLANFILFNKLAVTFDVVGRVCENFPGISFENIRRALISDSRIGRWGFYDSVYAGGSCFIKDAASLAHQLEEAGAESNLIRGTLAANNFQRDHFLSRAEKELGISYKNLTVAMLGVAFKRDTNDIRNSPAIDITKHLIEKGVREIKVYDPAALPMFQGVFDQSKNKQYSVINYCKNEEAALKDSNICLILADWPQFRSLGEKITKTCPAPYVIMDGRRIIQHQYEKLAKRGYSIIAVGSPTIKTTL